MTTSPIIHRRRAIGADHGTVCGSPESFRVTLSASATTCRDCIARTTADELAATMALRCLGCGAELDADHPDADWSGWHHHGTSCRRYYGAGRRVDYDRWLELVANDDGGDRPYFRRWAEGEPMSGVPSWTAAP